MFKQQVYFPVPYATQLPIQSTPQRFSIHEAAKREPWIPRPIQTNLPSFTQLFDAEKMSQQKHQLLSQNQRPKAIEASPVTNPHNQIGRLGDATRSDQFNETKPLNVQSRTEHQLPKTIDPDFDRFRNQSEANGGPSTNYTDCSSRKVLSLPIPRINQEQAQNQVVIDYNCPKIQKVMLQAAQQKKKAQLKAIQNAEVLQLSYSNAMEHIEFDFGEKIKKLCSVK